MSGNSHFRNSDYAPAISYYDKAANLGFSNEIIFNNRGEGQILPEKLPGSYFGL
jgi:hypothetical protein